MKLAILSPLPPVESGIASYVARTAEIYASRFDVIYLTIQSEHPDVSGFNADMDVKTFGDVKGLEDWLENFQGKLLVHMGNNVFHLGYLDIIKKFNPFVIMHDFVMHHLFFEEYVLSSGFNGYQSITKDTISIPRSVDGVNKGVLDEKIKFLEPLCEPIFEHASEVFVHSYSALNWAGLLNYTDKTTYIPFIPPEHKYENKNNHVATGVEEFKFAHFGHVTPPKQIESFMKLLKHLRECGLNARLDCYGSCDEHYGASLVYLSKMLGLSDVFKIHGWQTEDGYSMALAESDFIVVLRYPWAGETSAAAYDALTHGKKLVVLDYASFSELPGEGVIRIPLESFLSGDYEDIVNQIKSGISEIKSLDVSEYKNIWQVRVDNLLNIISESILSE